MRIARAGRRASDAANLVLAAFGLFALGVSIGAILMLLVLY